MTDATPKTSRTIVICCYLSHWCVLSLAELGPTTSPIGILCKYPFHNSVSSPNLQQNDIGRGEFDRSNQNWDSYLQPSGHLDAYLHILFRGDSPSCIPCVVVVAALLIVLLIHRYLQPLLESHFLTYRTMHRFVMVECDVVNRGSLTPTQSIPLAVGCASASCQGCLKFPTTGSSPVPCLNCCRC